MSSDLRADRDLLNDLLAVGREHRGMYQQNRPVWVLETLSLIGRHVFLVSVLLSAVLAMVVFLLWYPSWLWLATEMFGEVWL